MAAAAEVPEKPTSTFYPKEKWKWKLLVMLLEPLESAIHWCLDHQQLIQFPLVVGWFFFPVIIRSTTRMGFDRSMAGNGPSGDRLPARSAVKDGEFDDATAFRPH